MTAVRVTLALAATAACVVIALLAWRSRATSDVVAFYTTAGHLQLVASHRGGLVVMLSEVPSGRDKAWDVDHLAGPADEVDPGYDSAFDPAAVSREAVGFKLASGTFSLGTGGMGWPYRAARVPHWAAATVAGLVALWLWRPVVRCWRWARQGRCKRCGYDLRESPGRCPECGAGAAAKGSPTVAGWLIVAGLLALGSVWLEAIADVSNGQRVVPDPESSLTVAQRQAILQLRVHNLRPTLYPGFLDEPGEDRAEMFDNLGSLITETINPDSWVVNSGSLGRTAFLENQLRVVVVQTPDSQRQLAQLFEQLADQRFTPPIDLLHGLASGKDAGDREP